MATTLEVSLASGMNEAEERIGSGEVDLTNSDLGLGGSSSKAHIVGLRFNALDIPEGAVVTKAYIQFEADEIGVGAASFQIRAEDTDNALQFTGASGNLSSRATTDAVVNWTPPAWNAVGEAGAAQRTSDLSALIQEIIDRPGWQPQNSLAFLISGTGSRSTESHHGDPAAAPRLIIEYIDVPRVSLTATANAAEPNVDGLFTVNLSQASATDTVVAYTVSGTATPGSDYQPLSGTVTIAAGQLSTTISVKAIDDLLIEANETVTLRLDGVISGEGNTVLSSTPATVTLTSDDTPTIVSVAAAAAASEPAATGMFNVTLSKISAVDTVIKYTVAGSATPGSDYQPLSGTLTVAAGQLSATISVDVIDDLIVEGNETVTVKLNSITAGPPNTIINSSPATITIVDNEAPPPIHKLEVSLASGMNEAEERIGSGEVDLTNSDLGLGGSSSKAHIVGLRFNALDIPEGAVVTKAYIQFEADEIGVGAASFQIRAEDTDNALQFTGASGNLSSRATTDAVVNWTPPAWNAVGEAGAAQRTSDLSALIQEIIDRPGWQPQNSLAFLISGTGSRSTESHHGDPAAAPRLIIEYIDVPRVSVTATANAAEPNVDGLFTVNLSQASATDTVVAYTVSGTATPGSDYQPLSGTVTIAAGQLSTTISVKAIDDLLIEANETVTLRLDGVISGEGNTVLSSTPATVTLTSDDTPTIVSVAAAAAASEPAATGMFNVTLSKISAVDTVIKYTVAGSATPGSDYQPLSGTLTVAAGQLSATISVDVIDDLIVEGNETVTVKLNSITAGPPNTIINSSPATITIADDDIPLRISVLSQRGVATESAPAASVDDESDAGEPDIDGLLVVRLNKVSLADTVIQYTVTGTATADKDYHALSGTVTILAGQLNAEIPIEVIDDFIFEGDETVTVRLDSVVVGEPGATIDTTPATITIVDNEAPPPIHKLEVSLASGMNEAEERIGSGEVDLTNSDLGLGGSSSKAHIVGLRFNALDIPEGAVVTKAYIQFEADEIGVGAASFQIRAEDTDNALQFTGASGNLSSRATTDAVVNWTPPAWNAVGEAGAAQRTSDLSALIQEIIDRPGWQPQNSLAFLISGTGSRSTESHHGDPAAAPRLIIEYIDVPRVSVTATANAAEPNVDGLFTVNLSQASATDTVVAYTVSGTATPGSDYQPLSGTVTIAAGQLSTTISVKAIDEVHIRWQQEDCTFTRYDRFRRS